MHRLPANPVVVTCEESTPPGGEKQLVCADKVRKHRRMMCNRIRLQVAVVVAAFTIVPCRGAEELFRDDFNGKLAAGWSWVREDRGGWRTTERGLEVRVQPGNMWGAANNASNVLTRPLPALADGEIEVAVTVENRPTEQYEQTDLVWYYDDSHQVKIGQELVDGKLSLVMGREEKDHTRTIAILPIQADSVRVRFVAKDDQLRGEYRLPGQTNWITAGECDLPANGLPKASLQVYQGPRTVERWARFTEFRIMRRGQ